MPLLGTGASLMERVASARKKDRVKVRSRSRSESGGRPGRSTKRATKRSTSHSAARGDRRTGLVFGADGTCSKGGKDLTIHLIR